MNQVADRFESRPAIVDIYGNDDDNDKPAGLYAGRGGVASGKPPPPMFRFHGTPFQRHARIVTIWALVFAIIVLVYIAFSTKIPYPQVFVATAKPKEH
jgi:hypothetical protein